jgi:hypothetical protein
MTLPRRRFLHLAAGAVTLPMLYTAGRTQTVRPLAERLADYVHGLRYDDSSCNLFVQPLRGPRSQEQRFARA